ncbi:helix-hairpin-helix domain-containing protein [Psychrobacter sp. ANT_H56B]|nr:ComEA family DNA-binding protein [Psychrobacter sp. ANT_H56B]KAA0927347.1 helix-hairpin-helix domain-containing protein [Psychrobacter sp. ANT_H56B]
MNAPSKYLLATLLPKLLQKKGFYLVGMLSMIFTSINTANAVPCFDNAQSAYNYLLTQETVQTQARMQSIININRATESELTLLHGIGSNKAQAIILYREMFGSFRTVDELTKVKGIAAKTVDKNRGRLTVQD